MTASIENAECLDYLRGMASDSVHCCVTSPPYWGLRDYGHPGQLGLERTPEEYVAKVVEVFREVRRVLRPDGTLWLNLGDSYASTPPGRSIDGVSKASTLHGVVSDTYRNTLRNGHGQKRNTIVSGLKPKDLVGVPWRVAFALQNDGWWLRQDIIWSKPNPMPESVTDRCTKAHEYIFLLSKSERYYFDADAIAEQSSGVSGGACFGKVSQDGPGSRRISDEENARIRGIHTNGKHATTSDQAPGRRMVDNVKRARAQGGEHDAPFGPTRNRRSVWNTADHASLIRWLAETHPDVFGEFVSTAPDVWTITTKPYKGAHFATFPPKLILPCILAGCPRGGTVLDPFLGSGTTAYVALQHGRNCIGIELNPEYCELARKRIAELQPHLF